MVTIDNHSISMLQYESLCSYRNIFHFVSTRKGGVGTDTYDSFNLSTYCGDNPKVVIENRKRLYDAFGVEILLPFQTHDDKILSIDTSWKSLSAEEQLHRLQGVDALITNQPKICIGVSTADCVPLIFYDPVKYVVAVAHAGWRGTVKRIASKTVAAMVRDFDSVSADIKVAIGPSISLESFEVGEEVVESFRNADYEMEELLWQNPQTSKSHVDLWKANMQDLIQAGVKFSNIDIAEICTVKNSDILFSARVLGIKSGRIISGIQLISKK
ncbi:MAG: peptidoglycan editing factor PgeF [Bacteroidales bacterium]